MYLVSKILQQLTQYEIKRKESFVRKKYQILVKLEVFIKYHEMCNSAFMGFLKKSIHVPSFERSQLNKKKYYIYS